METDRYRSEALRHITVFLDDIVGAQPSTVTRGAMSHDTPVPPNPQ